MPVPRAQVAALQRQRQAFFAFLQLEHVALLLEKQPADAKNANQDHHTAQRIAQQAGMQGGLHPGQGCFLVQAYIDHHWVVSRAMPGVVAHHIVQRCLGQVFAALAARVDQKTGARGLHGFAQHAILLLGARQIAAVVAQQHHHIARLVKHFTEKIGDIVGRQRQHHHAGKGLAVVNRPRELDRPAFGHPALHRMADEQPWRLAQRMHREVLAIGNRHRLDAAGGHTAIQAGKQDGALRVGNGYLQHRAFRKCLLGGFHCLQKLGLLVGVVAGGQGARHIVDAVEQRANLQR